MTKLRMRSIQSGQIQPMSDKYREKSAFDTPFLRTVFFTVLGFLITGLVLTFTFNKKELLAIFIELLIIPLILPWRMMGGSILFCAIASMVVILERAIATNPDPGLGDDFGQFIFAIYNAAFLFGVAMRLLGRFVVRRRQLKQQGLSQ